MANYVKKKPVLVTREATDLLKTDPNRNIFKLPEGVPLGQHEKPHWQHALEEIEDIYNNSPAGFHSLNDKGVFIRINDTELNWLGYSREEIIGTKNFKDIITPRYTQDFRKKFSLFKKQGFISEQEFEYIRKDGTTFPVLLSANAIYDEKGKFKMSRTIVFNISDRKQLDHQLLKSHEDLLQSQLDLKNKNEALNEANENLFLLNREKDRFIGIASHDLKTPLVSILMLSELLLLEYRQSKANQKDDKYEVIKTINDAGIQMKEMIANYLDVNRIESGAIRLNLQKIDITRQTQVILSRHEEIARRKSITIFYITKKQFFLNTDLEAYTQVLENLLSNAIKYTPLGRNIFVKIYSKTNRLYISVQDQGIGIHREEMPLLFKKFQKLSSKPTGGELSTGLGLSIVKFLTDQLGGTVKVTSKPGMGSSFTVVFPLYKE